MSNEVCITRKEIEEIFVLTGYEVGYEKIVDGVTDSYATYVFYYRDFNVVRCKFNFGLLEDVDVCNELVFENGRGWAQNPISTTAYAKTEFLNLLLSKINNVSFRKPTILASFTGVIFKDYAENSDSMYKKYVSERKEFAPGFENIFSEEFESLRPLDTPAVTINKFDCFMDSSHNLWYVSEVCHSTFLLTSIFSTSFMPNNRIVEIRELMNQNSFQRVDFNSVCEKYVDEFYDLLSCLLPLIDSNGQLFRVSLPEIPESLNLASRHPVVWKNFLQYAGTSESEFIIPLRNLAITIHLDMCSSFLYVCEAFDMRDVDNNCRNPAQILERQLLDLGSGDAFKLLKGVYKLFLPMLHYLGLADWFIEVMNCYYEAALSEESSRGLPSSVNSRSKDQVQPEDLIKHLDAFDNLGLPDGILDGLEDCVE